MALSAAGKANQTYRASQQQQRRGEMMISDNHDSTGVRLCLCLNID
jgi:hypothetical protein